MKKIVLFLLLSIPAFTQEKVNVAEMMIRVPAFSSKTLYYGFAPGDKVSFVLSEVQNRKIGSFQISEYPSNVRFLIQNTNSEIQNAIETGKGGVLKFKLKNKGILPGNYHFKIDRTSRKESLQFFDTSVQWVTRNDTLWKTKRKQGVIRYDTVQTIKYSRGIVSEHRMEDMILDESFKLYSKVRLKPAQQDISFSLKPDSIGEDQIIKLESWAFWMGVGDEGKKSWERNTKMLAQAIKGGASFLLSPLGAFAVGLVTDLAIPVPFNQEAEIWLFDTENGEKFKNGLEAENLYHSKSNVIYERFEADENRDFNIILKNNNLVQGAEVDLKISAVYKIESYGEVPYTETEIVPVKGKIEVRIPQIKTLKVPVSVGLKMFFNSKSIIYN